MLSLNSHPRGGELVSSLVEGLEFAEIFHGIRGDDPEIVKGLMQKALKGPIQPIKESSTATSNIGRNITFELLLGTSRLRKNECFSVDYIVG